MLRELLVEGLGVIERVELALHDGSSALTGETGAGKTLVVAALGLLMGRRADRVLIRQGASETRVEGSFVVDGDHPAAIRARAAGLLDEDAGADAEIVIARTVAADGRGRARVNGHIVPLATLAELGALLVEIAGQNDHQRIAAPHWQRRLLDAFSGPQVLDLARETASAVRALTAARQRVEELEEGARGRARELDVLSFEIKEIEDARLRPGELEELRAEATRLENAEAIAEAAETARSLIAEERGAQDVVASASSALARVVDADPALREAATRLDAMAAELGELARDLADARPDAEAGALGEIQERLALLARLARKYGDDYESIAAYLERSRERAAELASATDDLDRLRGELDSLREAAEAAAAELSRARRESAPRLEAALAELLSELALPGAVVEVALRDRELYEGGTESVELLFSANPGEPPRPLSKVASGGELSRLALALHLLASEGAAQTLVFDEVDAGVGGRSAQAVGEALARLARDTGAQVLVVTHLPQVAAYADHHYTVTKAASGDRTTAAVEPVTGDDRLEELSRMLAGMPESEGARRHAQELLEVAAGSGR